MASIFFRGPADSIRQSAKSPRTFLRHFRPAPLISCLCTCSSLLILVAAASALFHLEGGGRAAAPAFFLFLLIPVSAASVVALWAIRKTVRIAAAHRPH